MYQEGCSRSLCRYFVQDWRWKGFRFYVGCQFGSNLVAKSVRQAVHTSCFTGFNGHPDLASAVKLLTESELRWQSCLQIDLFPGDRVLKSQNLGMQEVTCISRKAG